MNQTSTAKVHEKVIFAFSGQGAAGPLPLNFLMRELPVFCQYTCRADDFLKERSYGGLIQLLCSGKISSTLEGQLFSFVFTSVAVALGVCSHLLQPKTLPPCYHHDTFHPIIALQMEKEKL